MQKQILISLHFLLLIWIKLRNGENYRYLQQLMYRYGSFLYAFQALAYHKTRYRAQSEHWFQCIPPGISLPKATIATLKAIQVF